MTSAISVAGCAQLLGLGEPSPGAGQDAGGGPGLDSGGPPAEDAGLPAGPDGGNGGSCARVPTFGSATNYPGGTDPRVVATGDLDHDAITDFIRGSTGEVTFHHGTGNGTFTSTSSLTLPGACSMPIDLVVSDVDVDGYQDVLDEDFLDPPAPDDPP